jgi:hypothetical protein
MKAASEPVQSRNDVMLFAELRKRRAGLVVFDDEVIPEVKDFSPRCLKAIEGDRIAGLEERKAGAKIAGVPPPQKRYSLGRCCRPARKRRTASENAPGFRLHVVMIFITDVLLASIRDGNDTALEKRSDYSAKTCFYAHELSTPSSRRNHCDCLLAKSHAVST